jgi:hypothetical protein
VPGSWCISEADVSGGEEALATLFTLAVVLVFYYGPALVYAATPGRSARILGAMTEWIMSHGKAVEIVVGIGFGAVFLWKGIGGLA